VFFVGVVMSKSKRPITKIKEVIVHVQQTREEFEMIIVRTFFFNQIRVQLGYYEPNSPPWVIANWVFILGYS
jgi:hypothetical protein